MRIRIKPIIATLADGRTKPVAVIRATERFDPEILRATGWAAPHRPAPVGHHWRMAVSTDGKALIVDQDRIFYAGPFLTPLANLTAEWIDLYRTQGRANAMLLLDPSRASTISPDEIAQAHDAGAYLHIVLPPKEN